MVCNHNDLKSSMQRFCLKNGWLLEKVLGYNLNKCSIVARIKLETGESGVIKYSTSQTPREYLELIEYESQLYNEEKLPAAPLLLRRGKGFFVISFCDAYTLRNYILTGISSTEISYLLASVIKSFAALKKDGPSDLVSLGVSQYFVSRINNLLNSGPIGTCRSSVNQRFCNTIALSSRILVARKVKPIVNEWIRSGAQLESKIGHNDLHGNNVLVSKTHDKLFVIDFERASIPGYWLVDVLYLVATVVSMLNGQKRRQVWDNALDCIIKHEPRLYTGLKRVANVLLVAASANHRFAGSAFRFQNTIKLPICFIRGLLCLK